MIIETTTYSPLVALFLLSATVTAYLGVKLNSLFLLAVAGLDAALLVAICVKLIGGL